MLCSRKIGREGVFSRFVFAISKAKFLPLACHGFVSLVLPVDQRGNHLQSVRIL